MSHVEKRSLAKMAFALLVFCAVTAAVSPAQTLNTLLDFNGTNGDEPTIMSLVQGTDGNLYGTTNAGGVNGDGNFFKITPGGMPTSIYSFCSSSGCTDGLSPDAGLVQGTDGNFYGTTYQGGDYNDGTVFKITPAGALTTLHNFSGFICVPFPRCIHDGVNPSGALVQGTDGNFYGTTQAGGLVTNSGYGTVFKITPAGALTLLYQFCQDSGCTDGSFPTASLVQGSDGNFYGTTNEGGANCSGCGTVFKITPAGALTTLHNFCSLTNCTDGLGPGGLVQGTDGNFYGTTAAGGGNCPFGGDGCGTVFKITPSGKLTTLYDFCSRTNCTDGFQPEAALVQGTDGNFYGTTYQGGVDCSLDGARGCGTVFKISPAGALTTLHIFGDTNDGAEPIGGLVQATNGNFYGTTSVGGDLSCLSIGCGTVFRLSVGLGPFLETRPALGVEDSKISILGQGFDSASIVKFGGVPATTVKLTGTTFLTATVPAGALTGLITVTTGSTTLASTHIFRVTPQVKSFTPTEGPEGTVVTIIGTGLKQASQVTFGGVKASVHTVESDTEVEADVPTGAKTGTIAITTEGGTATSAATFTVTQ